MPPEGAAPDPIAKARIRHERVIAWAVLAITIIGILVAGWRTLTVEFDEGIRILGFAGIVGTGYALVLFKRGNPMPWAAWARASVEVSCATVVMVLDMKAGPDYLVTSSTAYLYTLAIVLTSLRLNPRLTAWATILAIVEHLSIYVWVLRSPNLHVLGGALSMQRLEQELVFRLLVLAVIGAMGMMLAATLRKEISAAAEEERVRTAFGRYVDSRVVQRVLEGNLRVAPERRAITVMFVDIRDFTRMSESADPEQLFRLLSSALDAFAQEVQAQGGIVNKYLGDGLLAIFGAPEEQPDQSRRAIRAALRIVAEAAARAKDGRFPGLKVGVGLHAGDAVVGDLGGDRREFTAIGDVVNVAARVEKLNKELGTTILATEPVIRAAGDGAETRKVPPMAVRGRDAAVELFEVRGLAHSELSSTKLRAVAPG